MRHAALTAGLAIIGSVVLLSLAAGPAFAVSGGGYSTANQNCPPGYGDNLTPTDKTYPGCHTIQLSVESGGTDGHGNPSGTSNTHYFDMGFNQEPNGYLNEPCIGFIECPGTPGQNASLHSGCVGANTDGTGSAPAPAGSAPQDPGSAGDASNGCGDNAKGLGFSANFDYYQLLNVACPIVHQTVGPLPGFVIPLGGAGSPGFTDPCDYESKQVGHTSLTPHTGTAVAAKSILKHGLIVYFGGDDNQNHGEHDGAGPYTSQATPNDNGAENGTSDGLADTVSVTPQNVRNRPTLTHPEGAVNASVGVICTEGICAEATTQQNTVYYGCDAPNANGNAPCDPGTPSNGNVYDYSQPNPSTNSESQNCNNQAPASSGSCGPGGENADRSGTPRYMNTEPGVQLYEDPDPGRSPLSQFFGNPLGVLFPTPGVYAGTCGVTAGSPGLPTAQTINSTPVGNGAGQAQVKTGPCGADHPTAKHGTANHGKQRTGSTASRSATAPGRGQHRATGSNPAGGQTPQASTNTPVANGRGPGQEQRTLRKPTGNQGPKTSPTTNRTPVSSQTPRAPQATNQNPAGSQTVPTPPAINESPGSQTPPPAPAINTTAIMPAVRTGGP